MLPAFLPGHPLPKHTDVQWDIGAALGADHGADESTSPQAGILTLQGGTQSSARPNTVRDNRCRYEVREGRMQTEHRYVLSWDLGGFRTIQVWPKDLDSALRQAEIAKSVRRKTV